MSMSLDWAKKSCKKVTETVPLASKKALGTLKSKSTASLKGIQVTGMKLRAYFESDRFEEDLDQVINFLHIHNPGSKREFNDLVDRKQRVFEKSKYLKEQTALFVALTAAAGAEFGTYLGAEGAATGIALGTAAGVIVVTFVAGSVVVRRISTGGVTAQPV